MPCRVVQVGAVPRLARHCVPVLVAIAAAGAVDAEGGVSVAIQGSISARLVGEYRATRYRLDPDPSGMYGASGATDAHRGGRFTVCARY